MGIAYLDAVYAMEFDTQIGSMAGQGGHIPHPRCVSFIEPTFPTTQRFVHPRISREKQCRVIRVDVSHIEARRRVVTGCWRWRIHWSHWSVSPYGSLHGDVPTIACADYRQSALATW